jgi:transcription termination factor NusA
MAKFITSLPGVGGATAAILNKHGFRVVEDIANASPDALSAVPGFRASRAAKLIAAARATPGGGTGREDHCGQEIAAD